MPSRTGFLPFEVLFGHNLRSPKDLTLDEWANADKPTTNITHWMEQLNDRIDKLRTYGQQSKAQHDKNTKLRDILEGSLVLLCNPNWQTGVSLDQSIRGPRNDFSSKCGNWPPRYRVPGRGRKHPELRELPGWTVLHYTDQTIRH